MKRLFILTCVAAVLSTSSNAQVIPEISYQASVPTGTAFRNFVEKPSLLGLGFQVRKYLNNQRMSVGGGLSWFYFPDKKGKQTLELRGDDGTYTGFVTNYTNIYGLQGVFQYDLKHRDEEIVPFVRGGVGAALQNQRQDIGLLSFRDRGIQLLSHAEAGVRFRLPRQGAINLALNYHILPAAGDVRATSFAGLRIGYEGFSIR